MPKGYRVAPAKEENDALRHISALSINSPNQSFIFSLAWLSRGKKIFNGLVTAIGGIKRKTGELGYFKVKY